MRIELPQGWKNSAIGEQFERITRKNSAGIERVLTASGQHGLIDQKEFFNKQVAAEKLGHYFHLKNGEFAYNRSSMKGYPFGAIKRLDRYSDGVLSTLCLCFGLKDEAKLLSDYAVQLFESGILNGGLRPIARVGARAHGLLNVTPSDFMEVAFPLPPLPEQRKIAAILSSVDEAIAATEQVIEQTRRVKEGLLQELLTRGIGHTRFKQTPIGEIPESWRLSTIKEVAADANHAVLAGPFGTIFKAKDFRKTGVPIIQIRHVTEDGFKWGDRLTYMDVGVYDKVHRPYTVRAGDLLVTKLGTPPGLACLYPDDAQDGMVTPDVIKATLDPRKIVPQFAVYAYNCPATRQRVLTHQKGGTRPRVSLDMFYKLPLPLPPLDEQCQIAQRVGGVEEVELAEKLKIRQLQQTKAGLLQDLLTGKVRVSV